MNRTNYTRTLRALKRSMTTVNAKEAVNGWDDSQIVEPDLDQVLRNGGKGDALEPTGSQAMDALLRRAAPRMLYGGAPAHFYPPEYTAQPAANDCIVFPHMAAFKSAADYRASLAHELVHWSGADGRLSRGAQGMTEFERFLCEFGMPVPAGYVREELTAEIGAAFLLAALGDDPRIEERARYIAGWAGTQPPETRADLVDSAARDARTAVDYLLSLGGDQ